jgi:tetratricopeptide (TPR) repeat protein
MPYEQILGRLHQAVQTGQDYLVPVDRVPLAARRGAAEVTRTLREQGPAAARERVQSLFAEGALDEVTRLSALQVIAASPDVRDLAEASRLANLQEFVALDAGGPDLQDRLASADRHRGVVAFLMGRYEVALDWFTHAFERQRTAENVGNVLASLLALGDRCEAAELLSTVRTRFPAAFAEELEQRIVSDADLRELRG